ncbi:MAG TPA: hypothetical protein DC064_15620 [Cyanobacteria bacterium UBA9273]|nr:hypothetical protein [Cyanobacteria bacterium UBA9273]
MGGFPVSSSAIVIVLNLYIRHLGNATTQFIPVLLLCQELLQFFIGNGEWGVGNGEYGIGN